jgi:hypothetical protein
MSCERKHCRAEYSHMRREMNQITGDEIRQRGEIFQNGRIGTHPDR